MPELRKDPVVERWVIIATERARRPMDFAPEAVAPRGAGGSARSAPATRTGRRRSSTARAGSENGPWTVRVVPNKFPALHPDGEVHAAGEGIYDRIDGVGAHEVVIESPDHFASLGTLPAAHVGEILVAYRERLLALRKDPRLEYVLIFKNHGVAAGASLEHPHSQLIATPILPELVAEELEGAARYFRMKERCVWCDVVRQERRDGSRLVLEEDGFVAVAPFAPRFPFETWILPTTHRASFESLQTDEVDALARLLRDLIGRLGRLFDDPPYNFALHTAPLRETRPGALPLAPRAHAEADAARRVRAGAPASSSTRRRPRTPRASCARRTPRARRRRPRAVSALTARRRPARIRASSGNSSGVEHNLAKVGVAGSNPVSRSSLRADGGGGPAAIRRAASPVAFPLAPWTPHVSGRRIYVASAAPRRPSAGAYKSTAPSFTVSSICLAISCAIDVGAKLASLFGQLAAVLLEGDGNRWSDPVPDLVHVARTHSVLHLSLVLPRGWSVPLREDALHHPELRLIKAETGRS